MAWRPRTALVVALLVGVGSPRIARAQSAPLPAQPPGSVFVHVESEEPVDLQRATGDRHHPFYIACTSPCDELVPATGKYRIAGGGTRPSSRFELLANGGDETVVVSPASRTAFGIGIAAIAVGAAALVLGTLGLLFSSFSEDPAGPSDSGPPYEALGFIAGGLVAAAGGTALVVLNANSHVSQTMIVVPSSPSTSSLFPSDAAHRSAPVPGYPSTVTWPLLRLAF